VLTISHEFSSLGNVQEAEKGSQIVPAATPTNLRNRPSEKAKRVFRDEIAPTVEAVELSKNKSD